MVAWLVCPVFAQVDLGTPKSAAKSLYQAMQRGNASEVAQTIYTETPEQRRLIAAVSELLVAGKRLGDAAQARFGATAERFGVGTVIPEDLAQIESAEVKEADGIATITIPNQFAPMRFRKDATGWKLLVDDYLKVHEQSDAQAALLKDFASALTEISTEITAGRYPTAADAQTAVQQEFNEVMIRSTRPTTAPATQPK